MFFELKLNKPIVFFRGMLLYKLNNSSKKLSNITVSWSKNKNQLPLLQLLIAVFKAYAIPLFWPNLIKFIFSNLWIFSIISDFVSELSIIKIETYW